MARLVSERAGTFDAAIVACFGDPGLYAARELTEAPVVGIAEASFLLAMSLGHRFGIVSTVDRATPATWDLLRHYGVEARCAAVEPSEAEVLDRLATLDLTGVAEKLTQPTLIVTGKLDRLVPWEQTKRIADEAPGGRFVLYEEGSHVCNNMPYRYRPLVSDWMLEQLTGTRESATAGF